ncbi:hypothetical protein GCM10023238_19650 [Streptomyces heliomycini]
MVQSEQLDDLGQEVGAPEQRLQQSDLEVLPDQRQGNARQAGPRAHVTHHHAFGHDLREHRTVQQVPLPQSGNLARPDQAALHARLSEQLRVPDRVLEAIAEHLACLLGRGGKLRCLRHGGPSFRTVPTPGADTRTTELSG